jgi:hypothetical protein
MKKLDKKQKQEICGGIGPMMLWVAIMGTVMVTQTIVSTITSITDNFSQHNDDNKYGSYAHKKNSMYMRVSPFPARSAMTMFV